MKPTKNNTNQNLSKCLLMVFITTSLVVSAQTNELREAITNTYNVSNLKEVQATLEADYNLAQVKIATTASKGGTTRKETLANGTQIELQEIGIDGSPIYYEAYSDNASQTSRANTLHFKGLLDLDLDGSGLEVGVWDAGVALTTHQEYDNRVSVGDKSANIDSHATLVTGSIISSGVQKNARGVAYGAKVIANDWSRDKIEAAKAASEGLLLSNHSYGIRADRVADWYFGAYIKTAQDWDKIMFNAPYYLMVNAVGNEQKGAYNDAPIGGTTEEGFDLLLGFALSKNGLTVAAADTTIDANGLLLEGAVSSYSSLGPVDDGRIKPDLAGDGYSILSTNALNNTSYSTSSGTSMAAPGVTGALLLLQQYHEELYGSYMKAATLKGLALHTADDVAAIGPDYKMGWGVINAKKAAQLLNNKEYASQIEEGVLNQNASYSITVEANENEPLIASISWTDAAALFVNRGILNDTTKALVNDLDIRITQNGKTYLPWILNPKMPNNVAKKGDNVVDPFERIEILNPKGTYTITVSHKGNLNNGLQNYSLLISGIATNNCNLTAPSKITRATENDQEILEWNAIADAMYEVQYKNAMANNWNTIYTTTPLFILPTLTENTAYVARIRTFCSENIASDYSNLFQFTYKEEITTIEKSENLNGTPETTNSTFSVYPNPAFNELHINKTFSDATMYRIISYSGKKYKFGKANEAKIDVTDLPKGLYILEIQDLNGRSSVKFFKD